MPGNFTYSAIDSSKSLERSFDYRNLPKKAVAAHVAAFVSGIWQIHPFAGGNARTTAVFAIKHLETLGYCGIILETLNQ